jgi:hypothetical protein
MQNPVHFKTIDLVAQKLLKDHNIRIETHTKQTDIGVEYQCDFDCMGVFWKKTLLIHHTFYKNTIDFLVDEFKKNKTTDTIIFADYINETIGTALKNNNIQYADTYGNVYLQQNIEKMMLFIFINTNKKTGNGLTEKQNLGKMMVAEKMPVITKKEEKNQKPVNIFTEKAGLQVLFAVLCDEGLIKDSIRDLATCARVSVGAAQKYKTALKNLQYLVETKQGWQLHKREKLIARWIIGYQEILKPKYTIGRFDGLKDKWQDTLIDRYTYWGGEPAAELLDNYLEAHHFDIYTDDDTENLPFYPNKKGNITLIECFWEDLPTEEPFLVPVLLVYADLMCTAFPRNHEIAQRIYEKYLFE